MMEEKLDRATAKSASDPLAVRQVVVDGDASGAVSDRAAEVLRRSEDLQVPSGRALSLAETQALIAPWPGPRDPLPSAVDVLVVGAGPVGLTAANLLGALNVSCLLLEQKPVTSDTPKAIAVDDEYMRVLNALELADGLGPHTSRPFGVHFISPLGFVLVKVPGFITPNGFGNRNAVLQPVFEKILLRGSRRYPGVRCHYGASVTAVRQTDADVRVELQTAAGPHRMHARYLLACDGARSFIRAALDIDFPGARIDEPHLVVDLADFPDQVAHSRFFCNPRRPINSVPGPYGGRRLEFMLLANDDREEIQTDAAIRRLVDRHTPYKGVPLHIIRRTVYGFSERIAGHLQKGRVFLLGDAAHVMPPFGGQGMNTGARDAANLCWKIALVLNGRAAPRLLLTYETERRDHIRAIVDYSVRVGRLANIRSRGLAFLRDLGFAAANLVPGIRRYFREMRYLPKPLLRHGLIARGADEDANSLTGRIIPRIGLRAQSGERAFIDDLAGPGFALLGLQVEATALAGAAAHPLWAALAAKQLLINELPDTLRMAALAFTVDDDAGRALLARYRGKILVLRPDRYVAGIAAPAGFEALSDRLEEILGRATTIEPKVDAQAARHPSSADLTRTPP